MGQLRKDFISDRWVVIATDRAKGPSHIISSENHFSDLSTESDLLDVENVLEVGEDDLYKTVSGFGITESVPSGDSLKSMTDMSIEEMSSHIELCVEKFELVKKMKNLKYAFLYRNDSGRTHSDNVSSYTQFMATPVVPDNWHRKFEAARLYFQENKRCLYEDVLQKEIKDKVHVVVENDQFMAYIPYASRFMFEIRILPKKQCAHFVDGIRGCLLDCVNLLKIVLSKIRRGCNNSAYTLALYTAPIFLDDMDKQFLWHIDIIPRITPTSGFEKGTGLYINSVSPDIVSDYFRSIDIKEDHYGGI